MGASMWLRDLLVAFVQRRRSAGCIWDINGRIRKGVMSIALIRGYLLLWSRIVRDNWERGLFIIVSDSLLQARQKLLVLRPYLQRDLLAVSQLLASVKD